MLAIVGVIDFGMDPETALDQPRFHHQWRPDQLVVEKRISEEVVRNLEGRGHTITRVDSLGAAQAIAIKRSGRGYVGAHDPRVAGKAAGW